MTVRLRAHYDALKDEDAGAMTIRIAMWSGPRNISTAMMRSFENRSDCEVVDEPFYAAYLAETGLDHPMRDEVLAAQPQDWNAVRHRAGPDRRRRWSTRSTCPTTCCPASGWRGWRAGATPS